ncbi:hypothetical protein, partial [Halalkalibacter flavus]|uniref:hypothetical protein n=1 Tax=Halalkalibacter flavus TaxID=3090668 RepID=UPI002FC82A69
MSFHVVTIGFIQGRCCSSGTVLFIAFSILFMHTKKDNPMDCLLSAWQRPTLTGGSPQLPSALKS